MDNPPILDQVEQIKAFSGRKLIHELKKLFALIAIGNNSIVEPSAVLASIVDEQGKPIKIGDECDISQFNEIFMSRIQDAILF